MTYPILKNPEFVDLQKSVARVTLVDESGVETVTEFKVPAKWAKGVNPLWDRILSEFNVDKMRRDRNNLETRKTQDKQLADKKRKAAAESEKLRQLFAAKMNLFNLPFVANAPDTDKAAVRRAPDMTMLNLVASHLVTKYLDEKQMSFLDLFDEIDDIQDQIAQKK